MLYIFAASFLVISLAMAGFILREGKVNLSHRYSVYGRPAYLIAFIIIGYVPLTVLTFIGLSYAGVELVQPGNRDLKLWAVLGVALVVLLVCLLISAFIAVMFAEDDYWWLRPKKEPKRPRRRSPRRRLRYDEIEDLEEERARRAKRRQGWRHDEEDEEDRPRRRGGRCE
jgi:hypothetical protein